MWRCLGRLAQDLKRKGICALVSIVLPSPGLILCYSHIRIPLQSSSPKILIGLHLVLQSNPPPLLPSYVFLLSQLREKYGQVFTVYMGPRPVVILCGHEAVKEALVDRADEFSGRGELASLERNFQGYGKLQHQ